MKIIPFAPHYTAVMNSWLEARGQTPILDADLPKLGFMVFYEANPVACGFLRLCEGAVGIMDSYATNPQMAADIRDEALNLLTLHIMKLAPEMKLSKLIMYTADVNTAARGMKHGFKLSNQVLLGRAI